jgi:polyisoprenoid-binding protein YceI
MLGTPIHGAMVLALATLGAQAPTAPIVYTVLPSSRLEVLTGTAGLLGFAGHEHLVRAQSFSGRIAYDRDAPGSSSVQIDVLADSLTILTQADPDDVRKMTEAMRTRVLGVANHPRITFASRRVEGRAGADTLHVVGALTIRGQTRDVSLVVALATKGDTLEATTRFTVKQTEWGIRPYRGGPFGTVRVADEVTFAIRAVAVRERE